jgi:7-cyano-7-deazaguanine synthase
MTVTVLLSGGMDSAVALHWALSQFSIGSMTAWSMDYGQAHKAKELEAARAIAEAAEVPYRSLKAQIPWAPMNGDVLAGRNLMLLSVVSAQAAARSGGEPVTIIIGACEADAAGFPDCRPEFLLAAQEALTLGLGVPVTVVAPLLLLSKTQIVLMAKRLGAAANRALLRSWSCYRGGEVPCGECNACRKRAEGFAGAGMVDAWG